MAPYQEEDIVSSSLDLISATSTWLLVRHQWLITTMRCVLTGERTQPVEGLHHFDHIIPKDLKLPTHLITRFAEIRLTLENVWDETTKASHPMSGLSIFEQLNNYQALAHRFMLASTEANQKLIYEFAMRDSLTGARTRLTLASCLARELNHSKRYLTPSTIALIDQDAFKSINDRWGHVIGDQVIQKLVAIMQNNLRPTDKLFRFGGDEWLIVMPASTETEVEKSLMRIHEIYAKHPFKSISGETFFCSFTYGIAEASNHDTPEEWIAAADRQLYKRKHQ
jgi:diguanylate cyclase (GGDEF)-like protein